MQVLKTHGSGFWLTVKVSQDPDFKPHLWIQFFWSFKPKKKCSWSGSKPVDPDTKVQKMLRILTSGMPAFIKCNWTKFPKIFACIENKCAFSYMHTRDGTVWSNQIGTVRKRTAFLSLYNLLTTRLYKFWAKYKFCYTRSHLIASHCTSRFLLFDSKIIT